VHARTKDADALEALVQARRILQDPMKAQQFLQVRKQAR
jgi:hypothetical protein